MGDPDDFWNRANIPAPPTLSEKYYRDHDETDIDELARFLISKVKRFRKLFNSPQGMEIWTFETSRLYHLMQSNKKFRRDKFYHLLNLIKRCGQRLQNMDIYRHVSSLWNQMPALSAIGSMSCIYLPTRSMFEYLLTRVYGAFHLFLKIQSQCVGVARIILGRFTDRGHYCATTLAILAIVARLRILSIQFAKVFGEFYDEMLPSLESMKGISKFSIAERDSKLVDKLTDHLRKEKETKESNIDERKKPTDSINSNVLEMFYEKDDFTDIPLEGNLLSRETNSSDEKEKDNPLFCKKNSNKNKKISSTVLKSIKSSVSGTSSGTSRSQLALGLEGDKCLDLKEKNDLLSLLDILDDEDDDEKEGKVEHQSKSGLVVGNHSDTLLSMELASNLCPSHDNDLGDVIDMNISQEWKDITLNSKSPHCNGDVLPKGTKCKKSSKSKSSKGINNSDKKPKKTIFDDGVMPSKNKSRKSSEKIKDLVKLCETSEVPPKSNPNKSSGKTKDSDILSKTIVSNVDFQAKKKRKLEEVSGVGLPDTSANKKMKKKKKKKLSSQIYQ